MSFLGRESADESKEPFRAWCGKVGELSFLLGGIPMVALTATATNLTRSALIHQLDLQSGDDDYNLKDKDEDEDEEDNEDVAN